MLAAIAPALRSRNFRLFWFGQLISTTGASMQVVAEGWLIYELTQSTFWLGMVGLLALIPVLPISLAGGVLIDRVPRRKLIIVTQTLLLLQAAVFGLLGVSGNLRLWHIIVLYFFFGAILAIDHPARRAFLVELVDEKDLANAVALNATLFNIASLVGYAVAGVLIATLGAGVTMLINAATYLAPITALALIHTPDIVADARIHGQQSQRFLHAIWEGFHTLWKQPVILGAISLMAVVGGLTWPVFGLMPAYVSEVVNAGAMGLGFLLAAGALGSVLGTLSIARLSLFGQGRVLVAASLALPIFVIAFALSGNIWLSGALIVMIGALLLILQSLAITLVQINIPDRVRGRVMSLYSMLHAGADTGSNAAIGALAIYTGLPLALALSGGGALIYAVGLRFGMPAIRKLE
jgi:MFS family permease